MLPVCVDATQMEVRYEGPVEVTYDQVKTLLGYQVPINKLVNWNLTRAEVNPCCCSLHTPCVVLTLIQQHRAMGGTYHLACCVSPTKTQGTAKQGCVQTNTHHVVGVQRDVRQWCDVV